DESGGHPLEHGEVELAVAVEIGQSQLHDGAVVPFLDKGQIEDADGSAICEIDQDGHLLPRVRTRGELDDEVVHRPHRGDFDAAYRGVGHAVPPGAGEAEAPQSEPPTAPAINVAAHAIRCLPLLG